MQSVRPDEFLFVDEQWLCVIHWLCFGENHHQNLCYGCRLKFIRFFAERMSGWNAELTPSQQHHFRDAFEVELCARYVVTSSSLWERML